MKILQVVTLSEVGGAQKVLFNIVKGLHNKCIDDQSQNKFEFQVTCAPGGEMVDWLRKIGVQVYEFPELARPIKPFTDFKALLKLRKLMKIEKYDLVHCHSSKAGIVGRLAAWLAGVPRIVFTVHGWGVNESQPLLVRSMLGAAEKVAGWVSTDVVCVSKADYQLGKKFVNEKKLRVIYNGVEKSEKAEKWETLNGKLRRDLGIGDKAVIIAMAARLKKPKEPLLYLKVAERVIKTQGNNVHFLLIGDGPLRGECEKFIQEKKLEKQVHLLGTREDLIDLYPDFNIFALLSSWEGLPLTICEAMRAGLPIVASRVGGIEEQVVHGWNGFLIERQEMDKAVEYLDKLVIDERMRRGMGENSKAGGENLFRLERMVEEYKKLYGCFSLN